MNPCGRTIVAAITQRIGDASKSRINTAADYKLVFVGDATMSPYEIAYAGGSVEHWNEEPGADLDQAFAKHLSEGDLAESGTSLQRWGYTPSIKMIQELMDDRMYPLTDQRVLMTASRACTSVNAGSVAVQLPANAANTPSTCCECESGVDILVMHGHIAIRVDQEGLSFGDASCQTSCVFTP